MRRFLDKVKRVLDFKHWSMRNSDLRNLILIMCYVRYGSDQGKLYSERLLANATETRLEIFVNEFRSIVDAIERDNLNLWGVFNDLGISNILATYPQDVLDMCLGLLCDDDLIDVNYIIEFDKLLQFFSKNEGKQQVVQTSPEAVKKIYKSIIGLDCQSVLDFTCGSGGFLNLFRNIEKVNLYGQELNREVLAIAKLRFSDSSRVTLQSGDSLVDRAYVDLKVDAVVMNPPFNLKLRSKMLNMNYAKYGQFVSNANMLWLQLALDHLNPEGKAMVLLPNGSLSSQGKEGKIRQAMLEDGVVEAIISIPSRLFNYMNVASSIWVLRKDAKPKGEILLADLSDLGYQISRNQQTLSDEVIGGLSQCYDLWLKGEGVHFLNSSQAIAVNIEQLKNDGFNLVPKRYLHVEGLEENDLLDTVSLRKFLEPSDVIRSNDIEFWETKKISVANLKNSTDQYIIDVDTLDSLDEETIRRVKLDKGDSLLIAGVGEKLKASYLPKIEGLGAYALSNVNSFKVDTSQVRMDYLIQELNKNYITLQLSKVLVKGAAIPRLKKDDFLSLKIKLPSLKEQAVSVTKEKEIRFESLAKLHGFEDEIKRLKEEQRKDLGSKKHNIMQHLNNVKSSSDVLRKVMERNNGVLNADDVINPNTGVTVKKRFERLSESLDSVIFFVDNLTNELDFSPPETLNVHALLLECVQKGIQPENALLIDNSDSLSYEDNEPLISISKKDFEELYNNVIENACQHGFIDTNRKYEFRYAVNMEAGKVEVSFENNGKAFPKGMGDKEVYCTRGEKAGATANTGEGSWKICQIAQQFGAELEVIDEPENNFAVGIKLTFNLAE